MNLKSLRTSYSNLLNSFREAGVTLNESQQDSLDTFMISLENKLVETRDLAIKTTKKMVTEKLDAEYKQIFESLLKHIQENNELASKLQEKSNEQKVTKELAESVDEYLDLYVEEVLPKKTIVDYSRMQKLEQIHESLKNMLTVNEAEVDQNVMKLQEKMEKDNETLKTKVAQLETQLNESKKTTAKVSKKLDMETAKALLESKVKGLPEREAKIVMESLKNASVSEIKMKFNMVLEAARSEIQDQATMPAEEQGQKNLEDAINEVLSRDGQSANNDDNADMGGTPEEVPPGNPNNGEDTEELEEEYDGQDIVTESIMKYWISRC